MVGEHTDQVRQPRDLRSGGGLVDGQVAQEFVDPTQVETGMSLALGGDEEMEKLGALGIVERWKVNQVTPALFEAGGDAASMAALEVEQVRLLIREVGLAPSKAKYLVGLSKALLRNMAARCPATGRRSRHFLAWATRRPASSWGRRLA